LAVARRCFVRNDGDGESASKDSEGVGLPVEAVSVISSWPIQWSHKSQASTVQKLAKPTTDTGETLPLMIATKQQQKMVTDARCCTMTVASAMSDQNSYG